MPNASVVATPSTSSVEGTTLPLRTAFTAGPKRKTSSPAFAIVDTPPEGQIVREPTSLSSLLSSNKKAKTLRDSLDKSPLLDWNSEKDDDDEEEEEVKWALSSEDAPLPLLPESLDEEDERDHLSIVLDRQRQARSSSLVITQPSWSVFEPIHLLSESSRVLSLRPSRKPLPLSILLQGDFLTEVDFR